MKTVNFLLISLFASATAFAATPSKVHGVWATACEASGGMGTKHAAIILDNGKMLSIELSYNNEKCEGLSAPESTEATYTILSENADTVVIDAQLAPVLDIDSYWSNMKLQFKFRNAEAKIVDVTLLSAKENTNGVITDVDAETVNNAEKQTFYKNAL